MSDPILPFDVWAPGTTQASIPANDNALRSEILAGRVISKTTTAQPASPADGAIYIIPAGATGAQWAGFDEGDLAIFRAGTWSAWAPVTGLVVNMLGGQQQWDGAAWDDLGGSSGGAPVSTVSGTSHDITAAEAGGYLRFTATSAKTCTFRPESTEALPDNGEWHIRNVGAGDITLTAGSGVTLNAPYSGTLAVPPLGTVTVKRVAADVFDVMGVTA
jgi:hypothetical protein